MTKMLLWIACGVFLVAVAIGLGGRRVEADCASDNDATLDGRDVYVFEASGDFNFYLDAEWELKSDASWVTVQPAMTGNWNVENVTYTPSYLQWQDCIDSYVFYCEGNLEDKFEDGNVNSKLDAGLVPNHASAVDATFIPKVQ